MSSTAGSLRPLAPMVAFAALFLAPPVTLASWPFATDAWWWNGTSPVIADIDGDGIHDVVVRADNVLYCLDAAGNERFRVDLGGSSGLGSVPTLVDVDGDPATLEIVTVDVVTPGAWGGSRLFVLAADGRVLATRLVDGPSVDTPLVVDTDGDGIQEVYFGTVGRHESGIYSEALLFAFNLRPSAGTVLIEPRWTQDRLPLSDSTSAPAAADVDGDGQLEVVFVGTSQNNGALGCMIRCFRGDGSLLWENNVGCGNGVDAPALVDLDRDGTLELVLGSYQWNRELLCLDAATGSIEWTYAFGTSVQHTQAIADLDGDGTLEIVAATPVFGIEAIDHTGARVWRNALPGRIVYSSPTIADLDGDGELEIAVGTAGTEWDGTEPRLYVLDARGDVRWSRVVGGTIYSSPAVADLDGDGRLEILFNHFPREVACLAADGDPFTYAPRGTSFVRAPWPSFHGGPTNPRGPLASGDQIRRRPWRGTIARRTGGVPVSGACVQVAEPVGSTGAGGVP